jgi:hypothetical protein
MTWGQLRLTLQIAAPGVNLDLLDAWINARYEKILERTDWSGLTRHGTIQTAAAYQPGTDTVTLLVGSAGVTGAGTSWTSALAGKRFYRPGDTALYTVATVPGAGSLTLDRAYEGNGADTPGTLYPGAAYVLMQNVYALPADVRSVVNLLDPATGSPMARFSHAELDETAGARTQVGEPAAYAVYDDSAETDPPVAHRIEFWPPPLRAAGVPIEYVGAAIGFDGENTSDGPLPWVTTAAMLNGVLADIQLHLKEYAGAKFYEALFQEELSKMLLLEHGQKRKIVPLRMAPRFTRHRLARATRGYGRRF